MQFRTYAPLFCMLALGKTGEGAYTRDSDISMWRPLPSADHHVGARCLQFHRIKEQEKQQSKPWYDTSSYCTDYSYGFKGLSVQIARFHSQSRRGAYRRGKYTCAGTLAKNGRGAYTRGGGGYGWDSMITSQWQVTWQMPALWPPVLSIWQYRFSSYTGKCMQLG